MIVWELFWIQLYPHRPLWLSLSQFLHIESLPPYDEKKLFSPVTWAVRRFSLPNIIFFNVCVGFVILYYYECTISWQILRLLEFLLYLTLLFPQKNLIYEWQGLMWPLPTGEFYLNPTLVCLWNFIRNL